KIRYARIDTLVIASSNIPSEKYPLILKTRKTYVHVRK
ncbi:unnamed protein product, partial [Allacma fusca]